MSKLNFIDLFAGASGMSEGFIKSGFNPIAHIEMNEEACYTIKTRAAYHFLKRNNKLDIYTNYLKGDISRDELYKLIPKKILNAVLHKEITDDSIASIFEEVKTFQKGETVDLIIGGPPCQAYSLVGRARDPKNMKDDPRNKLYIQYGKFLKAFQPRAFVFENVPGLLNANKGEHFKNLKIYFKRLGYEVYNDTLDASDFGVTQTRKRVIIVGWKKENNFGFPAFKKLKQKYSVNDVFDDLPKMKAGDGFTTVNYTNLKNDYLRKFDLRNGVDFVTQHISRPHNAIDLEIYKRAIRLWDEKKERLKYPELPAELKTHTNQTCFTDKFKVINGAGLSHTVVAHIAKDGHHFIHPDKNQCRSISVREAARLQSFPDDFYFEGSRTAAFKQIGNAVPPLMARAIANKMKELLCQI
jgi:DNA (cytosine-5)-methyltransferase 1